MRTDDVPGAGALAKIIRDGYRSFQPSIALRLWTGERLGPETGPVIVLKDPTALANLAFRPNIGMLVELWMDKAIDLEDGTLFDLARVKSRVKTKVALKELSKWQVARALPALYRLKRHGKTVTAPPADGAGRSGSTREAIQYHYDVSNDFYRLFLDQRMLYSCAYFDGWHDDLEKAQHDKLDMICRKLRLQPGERLLDIGSGWGALLIHAVQNYDVIGHGVTLSQAQYDLAVERIAAAGLSNRITIELKPFQELTGVFDKISSIGMFEHVGFAHHDEYFGAVHSLLKPGGLYLHHAITRPAKKSLRKFHRKSAEYRAITRYIFPGGELDFIGHSLQKLEAYGFEVHDVEGWREHYARTLTLWAHRLYANFDAAVAMIGEPRARLWIAYLVGCAISFERGDALIQQTLASRKVKGPSKVPPTRRDLYAPRD
ncbi:SAM-dependent methyltransferase [Aureimonas frigidaquae]|uniref:Fatty acid synthase, cyclopropane-fatty-acyl-phospholipid synthase n=1 Tax=Aureimonas frigidaquae TaxID=424757 RepID=A0A0P0Z1G4_9HYPH|nr:cyclopropane-fatty-acyl-phospholipid synthase family protein [Aureimonas frigidaquae]BAT27495.1 fatty acid synthase, cyclopropane-fatty-acyl-phospholipid synthase [Aureimonas frigidaquae]